MSNKSARKSKASVDTSPTLLQGMISGDLFRGINNSWLKVLPPDLPYLALIWLIPLAVYLKTLPNSLYFIDAGVTLTAAYVLGIPTPPGYPTTTLIGHLFSWLPLGTPLYRMQLFSIVTSLATLTLVYYFVQRLFKQDFFLLVPAKSVRGALAKVEQIPDHFVRLVSFAAAILLAFCYQFWSQTLNVQPYIFTDLMLMTAIFILTWIGRDNNQLLRLGLIAVVAAALAAGGSTVMVFMVLPAVIITLCYLWNELGLRRSLFLVVVGVIVIAAIYSYLPIRAMQRPFLNWGNPQSVELFMAHVQGLGLSFNDPTTNKVTGFTGSPSAFIRVMGKYFYLLWMQFTPLALPLLLAGFYYLWKKNRTLFLVLLSIPVTNMTFGGLWLSGNQESWFLFSYIVFSIVMGIGLVVLYQWIKLLRWPKTHLVGVLLLIVAVLAPLVYWYQQIDRSGDHAMADYSYNLYRNLPKDAVLIGIYDTFQAATLDHHQIKKDRQDVFPVMTNMIYVLPWYREHLRHFNAELLPTEIDKMTKFSSESEYNDMLNYYVGYLLKKGRQVFVTQPVFSRSVLVGSNAGVFTPDPARFKTIPSGLTTKIIATDSAEAKDAAPKDSDFQFHFSNPEQYKNPYYYLESGYESSYQDMVAEYAVSYIAYAEELMKEKQAPLGGGAASMFGGGLGGGAGSVNLSAGTAIAADDKKKAADYLNKAYEIAPKSLEVLNRLAIAYANQGDFKKTAEFFAKAAELNPENLNLRFNLAKAYLDSGKNDEARDMLKAILAEAKDAQVAKQTSNLLSVISASDNPPLNWQTFTNDQMNLKFFYPEDFAVSFAGENVVKLSNNAQGLDELTFLFYSKQLKAGELIDDIGVSLPFVMDGISLGSQQVQIPGFTAKVKTYATGEKTNLLFLLRHNEQGFAIRINPGNSNKATEFGTILQSVRVLKP